MCWVQVETSSTPLPSPRVSLEGKTSFWTVSNMVSGAISLEARPAQGALFFREERVRDVLRAHRVPVLVDLQSTPVPKTGLAWAGRQSICAAPRNWS
jgi:hypothetical protein